MHMHIFTIMHVCRWSGRKIAAL